MQHFIIEQQESLATEKFSRNGRTLDLHLVAKNIAFVIRVASTFDLNLSPPTAKLVYDFDVDSEREKDVEAVKSSPLEITTHVDETGLKAAVEAKISVLSSHYEGAYFRIKFTAVEPITSHVTDVFSQPIKVISKRNQVKKIMERKQALRTPHVDNTPLAAMQPVVKRENCMKRESSQISTDSGSVQETLARMEETQRQQTKLIELLLQKNAEATAYQPIRQPVVIPDPEDMDFDTAFNTFLKAYKKLTPEERPRKLRKILTSSDKTASESLMDFVNFSSSNMDTQAVSYARHAAEADAMR